MRFKVCLKGALCAWLLSCAPLLAADKVAVRPILSGLDNPSGVAVQPDSGTIFVSDSGAGRILKVNSKPGSKGIPVVTGYALDVYGKGPMYNIGPLGLAFLGKDHLAVGGGSNKDGSEVLHIFSLGKGDKTLSPGDATHTLGPLGPSEETKMGEGNFYALAVTDQGLFVTSNGDDTKGWILKAEFKNHQPQALKPFIATKVATEVDAPVGITVDKSGNLIVSQMGEMNVPGDSLLTSYDPKTGKLLYKATADGLHDIAAVAFSPKTQALYAVDFAWSSVKDGGLYRLKVSHEGDAVKVTKEKVVALDKPSAMAFAPDGTLYVTVFGTAKEGSKEKPGSLVAITGL